MWNHRKPAIVVIGALLVIGFSLPVNAFTGEKYSSQAEVSMQQARDIAQQQVPSGKIVKEELEKEAGGTGLRYSFDIQKKGAVNEVGVDAKTGEVLESTIEVNAGEGGESQEKD